MYNYQTQLPKLFTEPGQRIFLRVRDEAKKMIQEAGCFRLEELSRRSKADMWDTCTTVLRMVELNEVCELTRDGTPMQYRMFSDIVMAE